MIFGFALLYDIVCVLFVVFMNTLIPDFGQPIEANKIQLRITESNTNFLTQIADYAFQNQNIKQQFLEENPNLTPVQIAGLFIIRYFYEPAISCLLNKTDFIIKFSDKCFGNSVNGLQSKVAWQELDCLISIYRFALIIGKTIDLSQSSQIAFPNEITTTFKKILELSIVSGNNDIHNYTLRMLSNSINDISVRSEIVTRNQQNISLHHVLDISVYDTLINEIQKDLKKKPVGFSEEDWERRKNEIYNAMSQRSKLLRSVNNVRQTSSTMLGLLDPSSPILQNHS